jgi:hypothetical protein
LVRSVAGTLSPDSLLGCLLLPTCGFRRNLSLLISLQVGVLTSVDEAASPDTPPTSRIPPSGAPSLELAGERLLALVHEYRRKQSLSPAAGEGNEEEEEEEELALYPVEARHDPPPSLEGHACVYVLRIPGRALSRGVGAADWFYVGETESVQKRLGQHRRRWVAACV